VFWFNVGGQAMRCPTQGKYNYRNMVTVMAIIIIENKVVILFS